MIINIPEVRESKKNGTVNSSTEAYQHVREYANKAREVFIVLFLGPKNNLISSEMLHLGTVDSAAVYPREVVRSCVSLDASSVILVHNHPSGDTTPSSSDKQITRAIVCACGLLGVGVLDHLIIGKDGYYSFGDEGLLQDMQLRCKAVFRENGIT